VSDDDYRIALRTLKDAGGKAHGIPDPPNAPLDDIVVKDVECFRLEQMDDKVWFACCYLAGSDERIVFHISYRHGQIVVTSDEHPDVKYEGA